MGLYWGSQCPQLPCETESPGVWIEHSESFTGRDRRPPWLWLRSLWTMWAVFSLRSLRNQPFEERSVKECLECFLAQRVSWKPVWSPWRTGKAELSKTGSDQRETEEVITMRDKSVFTQAWAAALELCPFQPWPTHQPHHPRRTRCYKKQKTEIFFPFFPHWPLEYMSGWAAIILQHSQMLFVELGSDISNYLVKLLLYLKVSKCLFLARCPDACRQDYIREYIWLECFFCLWEPRACYRATRHFSRHGFI